MVAPYDVTGRPTMSSAGMTAPGGMNTAGMMSPGGQHANYMRPDIPFIYQASQAGPNITGNQMMDTMIGMLAPMLMGIQQPVWQPQVNRGASVSDALYARDITTPLHQAAQNQYTDQITEQLSGQIGGIAGHLGISQIMGRSPEMLQRELSMYGGTDVGRMFTGALSGTAAVQSVMGGDPMGLMQQLVGNKQSFSIAGDMVDPMDRQQQAALAMHATDVSKTLLRASLKEDGMTPENDYTRGFKLQEVGEIGATLAQRRMDGMHEGSTDKIKQRVGETTRMLEAVTDISGGGSVKQLFQQLDKLVGTDWPQVDPNKLQSTLREITATAQLVGTSTTQFGRDLSQVSSTLGAATGVRNMTGAEVTDIAATSHIIAKQEGRDVQTVLREQTALAAVGAQSQQGKDLQLFEYMKETGAVGQDMYDRVQRSIARGTKNEQQSTMQDALSELFGSVSEARRFTDDPAMMAMVRNRLTPEGRRQAQRNVTDAQNRELDERSYQETVGRMDRQNQEILRQTGGEGRLTSDERTRAKYDASLDYLRSQGRDDAAQQLQDTYERVFESTGDESKALAAMNRAATHIPGVTPKELRDRQNNAVIRAQQERLGDVMDPTLEGTVVARAEMDAFGRGDTREERDRMADIRRMRSRKDYAGANAAWDEFKTDFMAGDDERTQRRRGMIETAGETAREDFAGDRKLAARTRETERIQRDMFGVGLTTEEAQQRSESRTTAIETLTGLRSSMAKGLSGAKLQVARDEAVERLEGLDLDDETMGRVTEAAREGDLEMIDARVGYTRWQNRGQQDKRMRFVDDQSSVFRDLARYNAMSQAPEAKDEDARKAREAGMAAIKERLLNEVQTRPGITEQQRQEITEALESGDPEKLNMAQARMQNLNRELGFGDMFAARRTGILDHSEAVRQRQRASGLAGSTAARAERLGDIQQKIIDQNQHLRDTMPQRAIQFLTGDVSFADVLGVSEGSEAAKAIGKLDEGKALQAAVESTNASAAALRENQGVISDVAARDDVDASGREQIQRMQEYISAFAAGGNVPGGKTKVTREEVEAEIANTAKVLAGTGTDENVLTDFRRAASDQADLIIDYETNLDAMTDPMRAVQESKEATAQIALGQGERAVDAFDTRREFQASMRATDGAQLGAGRLAKEMSDRDIKRSREAIALITGMDADEISGDPDQARRMLYDVSAADLQGFDSKEQAAYTSIVGTHTQTQEQKAERSKGLQAVIDDIAELFGGKSARSDADGDLKVSGTLVLLDQAGNQVGVGEDVNITRGGR